jgi:hypothetical protein
VREVGTGNATAAAIGISWCCGGVSGSDAAPGAANHPGETLTFAERVFDVKENIERVFAPNV